MTSEGASPQRTQGAAPGPGRDASSVAEHYKQDKMARELGWFASFSVAFAFVSIATGIFTTYGSVLKSSGPLGHLDVADRGGWPARGRVPARLAGSADPGDRLCLSVGFAIGQPGIRLDHRMDFVHLLGDRRRRGRLHGRLNGPAVPVRLRGHRRLGLRDHRDHHGHAGAAGRPVDAVDRAGEQLRGDRQNWSAWSRWSCCCSSSG